MGGESPHGKKYFVIKMISIEDVRKKYENRCNVYKSLRELDYVINYKQYNTKEYTFEKYKEQYTRLSECARSLNELYETNTFQMNDSDKDIVRNLNILLITIEEAFKTKFKNNKASMYLLEAYEIQIKKTKTIVEKLLIQMNQEGIESLNIQIGGGIINTGNSCFLNSAIQLLLNMIKSEKIHNNDVIDTLSAITFEKNKNIVKKTLAIDKLLTVSKNNVPISIQGNCTTQFDAGDQIRHILSSNEFKEYNNLLEYTILDTHGQVIDKEKKHNKPVSEMTDLYNKYCEYDYMNQNIHNILVLQFKDMKNLIKGNFDTQNALSLLNSGYSIRADTYDSKNDCFHYKYTDFNKYILIQLMIYEPVLVNKKYTTKKIDKADLIHIEENLNLEHKKYELISVIVQTGPDMDHGHYINYSISLVNNKKRWIEYDDNHVQERHYNDKLKEEESYPYILLYRQIPY